MKWMGLHGFFPLDLGEYGCDAFADGGYVPGCTRFVAMRVLCKVMHLVPAGALLVGLVIHVVPGMAGTMFVVSPLVATFFVSTVPAISLLVGADELLVNGALLGPYRCVGMLTVVGPRPPSPAPRMTKLRANVFTRYSSLRRLRVW